MKSALIRSPAWESSRAIVTPSRLAALLQFASPPYASQELRTEVGSVMTADRLRLGHDPSRHTAHAGLRTQALRDDPRETCRASQDAEVMSDWMLDRSRSSAAAGSVSGPVGASEPVPARGLRAELLGGAAPGSSVHAAATSGSRRTAWS